MTDFQLSHGGRCRRALLALVPALTVSFPIKKWSAAGALLAAAFYLLLSGADWRRNARSSSVVLIAVMVDRRHRRPRDTPQWKLEPSLKCRSCRKGRYAPPVHMTKLMGTRPITPYKWVHRRTECRTQSARPVSSLAAVTPH